MRRSTELRRELSALPPHRIGELRALMGHFWFGIHEAIPAPVTYLTILRDPVERVLSLFHYHVREGRLSGTIEEFLDADRGFVADNEPGPEGRPSAVGLI